MTRGRIMAVNWFAFSPGDYVKVHENVFRVVDVEPGYIIATELRWWERVWAFVLELVDTGRG